MPVSFVTPSTSWRDVLAEALPHVVERGARVLDRVVQQRRADRLGVEAHARADLRHADRVRDELLARLAALVGVALAGEGERLGDLARGRPARRASSECSEMTANRSASSSRSCGEQVLPERRAPRPRRVRRRRRVRPTRTCASGEASPARVRLAAGSARRRRRFARRRPGGRPCASGGVVAVARLRGRYAAFRARRRVSVA